MDIEGVITSLREYASGRDAEVAAAEGRAQTAEARAQTAEAAAQAAVTRAQTAEAAAKAAEDRATAAESRATAAEARVTQLQADLKALRIEYDTHMRTEHVPPVVTYYGADASGTSLAAQDRVLDKWGDGIAVRQFFTGFDQVAPRDERAAVVHCSWKPASVSAITEAAVTKALANLKPGDRVEVWHESDKKVRDGVYTFTEALARKNRFFDVVRAVRPDLLVVNTLTGWEAEPNNSSTKGNIDRWAGVKADLLGLDCDGIHGWPYPNYDSEIETAKAFVAKFPAYKGWCVPEFGTSRNSTNDSSGTARATWATNYAAKFKAAGAWHVCLYEYESTAGNAFTTSAEVSAWKGVM